MKLLEIFMKHFLDALTPTSPLRANSGLMGLKRNFWAVVAFGSELKQCSMAAIMDRVEEANAQRTTNGKKMLNLPSRAVPYKNSSSSCDSCVSNRQKVTCGSFNKPIFFTVSVPGWGLRRWTVLWRMTETSLSRKIADYPKRHDLKEHRKGPIRMLGPLLNLKIPRWQTRF